jgi:hypothetical protein
MTIQDYAQVPVPTRSRRGQSTIFTSGINYPSVPMMAVVFVFFLYMYFI